VVNISSDTIGLNLPGFAPYMASKAGVIGFTRALANDLGGDGITVNAVCPGLTHTPTMDAVWEGTTLFADLAEQQPIKREAYPADIAGVISFLASDDAAWITGQTIIVDGGLVKL
jgi:NAD(P)-dependent dehydrogenase (short-subunit alcohol dehydrogenase family)